MVTHPTARQDRLYVYYYTLITRTRSSYCTSTSAKWSIQAGLPGSPDFRSGSPHFGGSPAERVGSGVRAVCGPSRARGGGGLYKKVEPSLKPYMIRESRGART